MEIVLRMDQGELDEHVKRDNGGTLPTGDELVTARVNALRDFGSVVNIEEVFDWDRQ